MRIAENIIRNMVYNNVPKVDTLINSIIPKKVCSKCGQEKPVTEFYKRKDSKDGYTGVCKFCKDKSKQCIKKCQYCGDEFIANYKNAKYCEVCRYEPLKNKTEIIDGVKFKICKSCNNKKPLSDFFKNKTKSDGYENLCKTCRTKQRNKYFKICKLCGESFYTSDKDAIYCSRKCNHIVQQNRIVFNCDICGKETEIRKSAYNKSEHHYCSDECRYIGQSKFCSGENHPNYDRVTVKCEICGKPKEVNKYDYKIKNHFYCSRKCADKGRTIFCSGENSPLYDKSKTQEEREQFRLINGYSEFIKGVYERDNYTCVCCGDDKGGNLNAHHLNGYNWDKEHRTDINNGVTLCEDCHKEFHNIYGYVNNTEEQFEEFMNSRDNKSA